VRERAQQADGLFQVACILADSSEKADEPGIILLEISAYGGRNLPRNRKSVIIAPALM
jgi:hypothetical protein